MALKPNAFSLDFSEPTFGAWSQPGSSEELRKLQERHEVRHALSLLPVPMLKHTTGGMSLDDLSLRKSPSGRS
jgi:hypothetical protein